MPLLKRKALEKKPLPEYLKDDEEVFHCEVTNEIFRDYDEFAERTILCNSMVWTCAMTGRSNLTYVEALQSEENARKSLKDFPLELRIPVLYLANRTKRTSFADMADDVFSYIKERYFVGENVEASFSGNKWREYHVLQVISPSPEELMNLPRINGNTSDRLFFPPPLVYKYDLEQLDNDDDDVIEKMIADFTQIRRKKSTYTREKNKLFLKQYVEQNSEGVWCVKDLILESFGVNRLKFDQIFDGPLPEFETSKKTKSVVNGKKVRQETLAKYLSKNSITDSKESKNNLLDEMKKRQMEFKKAKEELKIKTAEEKLAEKQKKKEENMKVAQLYKEWYKSKDDLELEDQKKIPDLMNVRTKIPEKYLGEVFMILEFVHTFSKILSTKNFFTGGFTIDIMERALTEKEVAGPLIDIMQMFLNAIFALQEEEATQTKTDVDYVRLTKIPEAPTLNDYINFATWSSKWSRKHQGVPLSKLPMYSLTVSEILRLHLLSSGARINETGTRWRFQQRGGYTNEDDPGLHFKQNESQIMNALSISNVIQLNTDDKLKIITCLIDQLLTYADVRDIIEERLELIKQKKIELKTAQFAEKKRCAEIISPKLKLKNEVDIDKKEFTLEMEKIKRDSLKQQAEYEKKIEKLMKSVNGQHVVLGYDRGYRRYIKLDCIPGIFIDSCEINCGTCLNEIIHQEHKLVGADRKFVIEHLKKASDEMNTSDKENDPKKTPLLIVNGIKISHEEDVSLCKELFMCSADANNCLVHSGRRDNYCWKFLRNEKELDELINSLNKRGMRESELRQVLQNSYSSLTKVISSTPDYLLNSDVADSSENKLVKKWKNKYEDANFGYPSSTDPVKVLRATLIEIILEMEEKITAGNLGTLKVKDRTEWRKCLTECNFENFDRNLISSPENGKQEEEQEEDRESRESTADIKIDYYRDPGFMLGLSVEETNSELIDEQKQIIECLSIALAQVAHSVDDRYLKRPLGHCDVKKDNKLPKDVLKYWEQSLLASTSYSQVFLHYGTLDSSITWSKSALLARCRICRRQSDSENMLLCDNCNFGYHLYCLKPKLDSVPQGEWFCNKCLKDKERELKIFDPEKRKRRIFRDEDVDDEEDEAHMDVDKISERDNESGGEDNDSVEVKLEVCVVCGSGGELLSCEKCPNIYHIECIQPPLRRKPRGVWLCSSCREKKANRENDDTHTRAQRTGVLLNQRRCATRARLKIHGFVKSLRGGLSSDDSDDSTEISSLSRRHRREAEDLPLHNAELQDLLLEVMKHKDAWPFIRPVQKNEVPDYYDVITKPMDFGTIKYKLNMGEYTCDEEFMSDAVLVFENCNTYNDSDADVYRCGVRLLKVFEKKSRELGLKLPEEMQDDEEVNEPLNKKKRTKYY